MSATVGQRIKLVFTQDGTGSRTGTFSQAIFTGGSKTLSTTTAAVDTVEVEYLEIIATPVATVPRPNYIVMTDIRKIATWIDDLQVPDSSMGFDDQLADSRDWLDEMTLRNYRGGNDSLLGYHGFALDAWYTGGGRRTSLTNRWLFAALAANQLLVTPRVKQVCACYALSRICESMITKSGQYVALASRFRFEAESLLASTRVEIDVNGDGFGEVPIKFSSTNTLWA